jgi:hypothetical protein
MERFNPLKGVGVLALLGVIGGAMALSGRRHLSALGLVPGVVFSVLGARIAYEARLARGADQIRAATLWNAWTPWYYRQVNGAVIAIFGLFFLGLGAEGIAKLVS